MNGLLGHKSFRLANGEVPPDGIAIDNRVLAPGHLQLVRDLLETANAKMPGNKTLHLFADGTMTVVPEGQKMTLASVTHDVLTCYFA